VAPGGYDELFDAVKDTGRASIRKCFSGQSAQIISMPDLFAWKGHGNGCRMRIERVCIARSNAPWRD
jgi:hypothetical protein